MPVWSEILVELVHKQEQGHPPDFDGVRRKYLAELNHHSMALSVFHATTHTFSGTPSAKIVKSHKGRAFIKQHIVQPVSTVQVGILQAGPERSPPQMQNLGLSQ